MSSGRRRLGVAFASALGLLAFGGAASAVPRLDASYADARAGSLTAGTPGFCPTKAGVTVVVDFNELGGGIVVRCAPGPVVPGFTGLDAMRGAGLNPTGTQRWGLAFVCRIAGKPSAGQTLHIEGNPHYKEACVDTPPVAAFWSYWYAPNGGSWKFSSAGPGNRDAIPGGFEGWSFSLNHTQESAPAPGIAPRRPQQPPPTTPPPTGPTHPTPPPTHPTHGSGGAPPTSPATSGRPTTSAPTSTRRHEGAVGHHVHQPTPTTPGPTAEPTDNPVAVGHNAAGEKVTGTLPQGSPDSGGSARTAVIGVGVLVLLAAGGGLAAWRRRAGP